MHGIKPGSVLLVDHSTSLSCEMKSAEIHKIHIRHHTAVDFGLEADPNPTTPSIPLRAFHNIKLVIVSVVNCACETPAGQAAEIPPPPHIHTHTFNHCCPKE